MSTTTPAPYGMTKTGRHNCAESGLVPDVTSKTGYRCAVCDRERRLDFLRERLPNLLPGCFDWLDEGRREGKTQRNHRVQHKFIQTVVTDPRDPWIDGEPVPFPLR